MCRPVQLTVSLSVSTPLAEKPQMIPSPLLASLRGGRHVPDELPGLHKWLGM